MQYIPQRLEVFFNYWNKKNSNLQCLATCSILRNVWRSFSIHLLRYFRSLFQYIPQFLEVFHNFWITFVLSGTKQYIPQLFGVFLFFSVIFLLHKYQTIQGLATCSIFRNVSRSFLIFGIKQKLKN